MEAFIFNLFIFVLASFVGFELISKVPPTLHTPLMSGSNAISGITLIGALIISGSTDSTMAQWIGFGAIVLATINVAGGFIVTDRMLEMFKKRRVTDELFLTRFLPGIFTRSHPAALSCCNRVFHCRDQTLGLPGYCTLR